MLASTANIFQTRKLWKRRWQHGTVSATFWRFRFLLLLEIHDSEIENIHQIGTLLSHLQTPTPKSFFLNNKLRRERHGVTSVRETWSRATPFY